METEEPPGPEPVEMPSSQASSRSRSFKITLAVLVSVVLLGLFVVLPFWLAQRVPYYSFGPGPTKPVENLLRVPEASRFPHEGDLYFTTVNESDGRLYRVQYLFLKIFKPKNIVIQKSSDIEAPPQFDCTPEGRTRDDSMSESQRIAISIALRRMHKPVTIDSRVQVAAVIPGTAAVGQIRTCEYIIAVDDIELRTGSELRQYIQSKKPGDVVRLRLRTEVGTPRTIEVKLGASPDGRALLGVIPDESNENLSVTSPVNVTFAKTNIGGPSAGLAFTLGLIDDLTPGSLTGGQRIAATGEMRLDGTIFPIGGVTQKTQSVADQGIKLFIVPKENEAEAKRAAPKGLKIVGVDTLDEALAAIAANGGSTANLPPAVDLSRF